MRPLTCIPVLPRLALFEAAVIGRSAMIPSLLQRTSLVALLLLTLAIGGCVKPLGEPYRVKITLEADVLGKPRRVEQVFEIRHALCSSSFCSPRILSGDAIAFDVDDGGVVMALLDAKISNLLFAILKAKLDGNRHPRDVSPMNTQEVELVHNARASDVYTFDPDLAFWSWVHFTDKTNPSSGRHFDVSTSNERHIAPVLDLKTATIQKTSEPVTRKIRQLLPWIDRYAERDLLELPTHERVASVQGEHPIFLRTGHFTKARD
jgi:hypothetical protein